MNEEYQTDPRVDDYLATLPDWQQNVCRQVRDLVHSADPEVIETIKRTKQPYFVLYGNICALLGTKDHLNIFIYDPIAPDPEGIINQGQGNQTGNNTTAPPPSPSNGGGLTPDATIWLVTFVAVISVMVVVSMRFLRTGRVSVGLRRENLSQRATSIVNEALSELRTTDDARGAVIRAYWQMNRLFGKRDEEAFLTPKEFAHLLVTEYGWPSKAVDDLTKVFEEARYSEHAIGDDMRELAVGSLQQIRDALLGRRSGSHAP